MWFIRPTNEYLRQNLFLKTDCFGLVTNIVSLAFAGESKLEKYAVSSTFDK